MRNEFVSQRMMGISKGSGKALCFVIDTTKSMSDDIEAVKAVTSSIIDSEAGTDDEPSFYILVPFNDPGGMLGMVSVTLCLSMREKMKCKANFFYLRFWPFDKDNRRKSLQECYQLTLSDWGRR